MQFSSFSEFIAMGNHGFYVWLSYGVCLALLTLLVILSINKNKLVIRQIKQRQQRETKLQEAAESHKKMAQVDNSSEENS